MIRRKSAGFPQTAGSPNVITPGKKSSSTSKLRDIFGTSSPSLEDALTDFESAGKLTLKLADVQRRGATRFSQWAMAGDNTAIDDVAGRMRELMLIYSEQQTMLAEEIMKNAQDLRKMVELEQEVKDAEKRLLCLIEREKQKEKELNRLKNPGFFSKPADASAVRTHLRSLLQAIQEREKAEFFLKKVQSEAEVAKMFQFRKGMKTLAESYCKYSQKTSDIFRCHRELTELVPAIATEDVQHIKYEGMPISREKVDQVRRSMDPRPSPSYQESQLLSRPERRRRSEPNRMGSRWEPLDNQQGTPPPPYSPGGLTCSR